MKNKKQLNNKTLLVQIKTKNHKQLKFLCCETEQPETYGNKKYIGVYKVKSISGEPFTIIDCRYDINYNFITKTLEYFTGFYGKNLKSMRVEWY